MDVEYDGKTAFAASYLVVSEDGGRGAFVDMGTEAAVPGLLAAARELAGLLPEQIELLIPTHIHLDHAAGCGELARLCPKARILCHPRAARHLADPTKLEAGVKAVYGEAFYQRLYGALKPIDAARIFSPMDEEWVELGGRKLQILHTPGHAKHHICIFDSVTRSVFSGDSFGLAYLSLRETGAWIFPSTSPSDFNPADLSTTVDRIAALQPERVLLTHFGAVTRVAEARRELQRWIAIHAEILAQMQGQPDPALSALTLLKPIFEKAVGGDGDHLKLLDLDIRLNAQGIAVAATPRTPTSN